MTDSEREDIAAQEHQALPDTLDAHGRERQRRINALHEMSRQGEHGQMPEDTLADTMSRPQRTTWRVAILIGMVVLVVAGSITGYLLISRSKSQTGTQKPAAVHAIDLSGASLYCPQSPVWSPDGRYLAVIGSDLNCMRGNAATPPQQLVGIFNVSTRKLQRLITIKDVLEQHQLVGLVSAVAWSPDGKILALFGAVFPTPTMGVNHPALILYSSDNAGNDTVHVITGPPQAQPGSGFPERLEVWNLHTMAAGPAIDDALPPALTYRWAAGGHIVPAQLFPSDASALTGRAATGNGFTFWQAGVLAPASVRDGHYIVEGNNEPTAIFFASLPVLWSPDSQYVVSGIGIGGPVAYSAPKVPALTCPSPGGSETISCPLQALPPSDPAFTAVVNAAMKGETITFTPPGGDQTTLSSWPEVPIAWSPNGKYLLTILPGNEEYHGAKKVTVTVMDTMTGNGVKQFQQDVSPGNASCYSGSLAWSPTGAQIALAQCSTDSIILWDTHDLST